MNQYLKNIGLGLVGKLIDFGVATITSPHKSHTEQRIEQIDKTLKTLESVPEVGQHWTTPLTKTSESQKEASSTLVATIATQTPEASVEEVEKRWPPGQGTTMFFNVPEARAYLLKHGYVYTLRPKMRRVGKDLAVYGSYYKHETIGRVQIDFVKEVREDTELEKYVTESGFLNVQDWLAAAQGSRFLFKVTIISGAVSPATSPPAVVDDEYCVGCGPNNHLAKAQSHIEEALRLSRGKGKVIPEVVAPRIQDAVAELGGYEDGDIKHMRERAASALKEILDDLAIQTRDLRNFLRYDMSGLELGKGTIEDLESAAVWVRKLRQLGYYSVMIEVGQKAKAGELGG